MATDRSKRRKLNLMDDEGRSPFMAMYELDHPEKFRENFIMKRVLRLAFDHRIRF